jgi:hypothetical protein
MYVCTLSMTGRRIAYYVAIATGNRKLCRDSGLMAKV